MSFFSFSFYLFYARMCKMEEILCGENSDHADLQAWNMSSKLFFGAFPFLPAAIQCRRAFLLHTFSSKGFEGLPCSHATIDTTFSFLLGMDALTRYGISYPSYMSLFNCWYLMILFSFVAFLLM